MQLRIKYVEGKGYYPQVKLAWWEPWKIIIEDIGRYYIQRTGGWPVKDRQRARNICMEYYRWVKQNKKARVEYEYLHPC